jgi:hypothetical protein
LYAFKSIAEESYKNEDPGIYNKIPFNEKFIMDLVLRNLNYKNEGYEYVIDIGINKEEESYNNADEFYYKASIEDVGDLSVFYGYEEYDMSRMEVSVGKTYPQSFNSFSEIEKLDFSRLFKEGYTNVVLNEKISSDFTKLPVNIFYKTAEEKHLEIKTGEKANLIIKENNEVKYVIVNGFVLDPDKPEFEHGNALVFK